MNKQELIEKLKTIDGGYGSRCYIAMDDVFELVEQLDEPQKVTIPQFVADWYEDNKDDFETSLFQCVYEIFKKRDDNELNEFEIWLIDGNTKPFQTLVNMHQFGYEVEKEKRYIVKMKNIHSSSSTLKLDDITKEYFFGNEVQMCASSSTHTRKELEEAGFGEVFNSPLFEVKEVEE